MIERELGESDIPTLVFRRPASRAEIHHALEFLGAPPSTMGLPGRVLYVLSDIASPGNRPVSAAVIVAVDGDGWTLEWGRADVDTVVQRLASELVTAAVRHEARTLTCPSTAFRRGSDVLWRALPRSRVVGASLVVDL